MPPLNHFAAADSSLRFPRPHTPPTLSSSLYTMSLGSCCVSGFKVRTRSSSLRPSTSLVPTPWPPCNELTRVCRRRAARGNSLWQDPGHQRCLHLCVCALLWPCCRSTRPLTLRFGQLADISLPKGDYDKTKALLFLTEYVRVLAWQPISSNADPLFALQHLRHQPAQWPAPRRLVRRQRHRSLHARLPQRRRHLRCGPRLGQGPVDGVARKARPGRDPSSSRQGHQPPQGAGCSEVCCDRLLLRCVAR